MSRESFTEQALLSVFMMQVDVLLMAHFILSW